MFEQTKGIEPMIKTAGVVFDFYDDNGETLRNKLGNNIPDFVKEAVMLGAEKRAGLPDNSFALVALNGEEKLRKYACVDKGNTATSVIYFLNNKDKLPKIAQDKAAGNLLRACVHFELEPPRELRKLAGKDKVLIKGDGAEMIVSSRAGEKTADLSGSTIMPNSVNPDGIQPRKRKVASVIEDPYVDLTRSEVTPFASVDDYPPEVYALTREDGNHSFPLVTYEQVKTASAFFEEQGARLHPRTRRLFCVKLAARADKLGIDVTPEIKKYGSRSYARDGDFEIAVEGRKQLWREGHDEASSLLDSLMEKKASLHPDAFAEALAELDIATGTDKYWGSGIQDPWYSTFGMTKEAEEGKLWRWQQGTEYLTEEQLKRLTSEGRTTLSDKFGEQLADGLAKNPVSVFDSLPLDQKRVIARMAAQQESGL